MERVNFQAIEKKWQDKFTKLKLYNKEGKKFYCISPKSPIGVLLLGKKVRDQIEFNARSSTLLEIL